MFYKTAWGEVINLDHLVTVRPSAGGRARGLMTDGSEVQLQDYDARLIVDLTRSVVAARPDDRAVVFTWYGADDTPTNDARDVPVVAWALDGQVMVPVLAEEVIERQESVGVLMPDGSVCDLFGSTWPTRLAFVEDEVRRFRQQAARAA